MTAARMRYAPIVLRAAEDAPEGVVEGYASVFDTEYRIGWGLKESIAPGAFTDSLSARDGVVPMFYQHDWDNPIGYLECSQDKVGLRVVGHLFIDANERARSVYLAMKAGALREWSIGFIPEEISVSAESDTELETVTRADLLEASVVVKGANPDTFTTAVRNAPEAARTRDDDTAGSLAQQIDATNDSLIAALNEGNVEQALALANAVDTLCDELLESLGEDDADDNDADDEERASDEAAAARAACDEDEDEEVEPHVEASGDRERDVTHLLSNLDKPWARALLADLLRPTTD